MTGSAQLEANIVDTVATVEKVLAQFEKSLVDAGFADGAQTYVRLADTVIGQRLWAESSGMAAEARFEAVAGHARAIHAMLTPYVDAFRRLGAIGAASLLDDGGAGDGGAGGGAAGAGATDSPVDPVGAAVLAELDRAGRPLSATALRAALGIDKRALATALDQLAATGHVQRTESSGRVIVARRI